MHICLYLVIIYLDIVSVNKLARNLPTKNKREKILSIMQLLYVPLFSNYHYLVPLFSNNSKDIVALNILDSCH